MQKVKDEVMQKEIAEALLVQAIDWSEIADGQEIEEYCRFLVMKTIKRDTNIDSLQLSPSAKVDVVWHAHLLLPKHYALVCQLLLGHGQLFDHSPKTSNRDDRHERYQATLALYQQLWGPPDPRFWPEETPNTRVTIDTTKEPRWPVRVIIVDHTSTRVTILALERDQQLEVIWTHIQDVWGISPDHVRLVGRGKLLEVKSTAAEFGLCMFDTINVVIRLSGC